MSAPVFHFKDIQQCSMCGAPPARFKFWGERLGRSQGFSPSPQKTDTILHIKKCGACGLIFPDPMPLPESAASLYDLPPENYWKEGQRILAPSYFKAELVTLRKYVGDLKGKKALDIGSGLGFGMKVMEEAGLEVWGVEPSPEFRQASIKLNPRWESKIQSTDASQYSFPEHTFDFINFGAVLEHLPDPGSSLLHALEHLSEGGVIHAEVPHAGWLVSRMIRWQFRLRLSKWVMNLSPMHKPYHLYEFSPRSFHMHAERNKYKVKAYHIFNTNSYLPTVADTLIRPVMELTSTGIGLKVWLGKI